LGEDIVQATTKVVGLQFIKNWSIFITKEEIIKKMKIEQYSSVPIYLLNK